MSDRVRSTYSGRAILLAALVSILVSSPTNANAQNEATRRPDLIRRSATDTLPDTLNVWVYFRDKGGIENQRPYPQTVVSERSLRRRLRVRPESALIDATDLPVNQAYVEAVRPLIIQTRHHSRWLNGVSVQVLKSKLEEITALPFVREVDTARRYGRTAMHPESLEEHAASAESPRITDYSVTEDSSVYGQSWTQLRQMNVPALHAEGNCGEGVLIGVLDDGFRRLNHEALWNLDIVATYDFAENKTSVVPGDTLRGGGSHGTMTLSTIAGYKPGRLIGSAFCASFVLARTEVVSSETPLEEDNWVAAIEWMDSIGVDITSTSLNYLDFDLPYRDGSWQEMDGNTALITRVADMAVSKGILVVVAGGNTGNTDDFSRNTLWAPADGDSVISVGAVDALGTRVSNGYWGSSFGPTTSNPPRIKPDVMAMGYRVWVANPIGFGTYIYVAGTSFSCPLVAGVAALLLRDVPDATPMEIINTLHATASNSATPNNFYGWGIVNALAARDYLRRLKARN